jgi:hypothetical protein
MYWLLRLRQLEPLMLYRSALMLSCLMVSACAAPEPVRLVPEMSKHTSTVYAQTSATPPKPDAAMVGLERLQRRPLSAAEMKLVEAGVRHALTEPHGSAVEGVAAGDQVTSGRTDVHACGYVRAITRAGGAIGLFPFVGMFVPAKDGTLVSFVPIAIGAGDRRGAVVAMCGKFGLLG